MKYTVTCTPEEYLRKQEDQKMAPADRSQCAGEFMSNVPRWLGEPPAVSSDATELSCEAVVIGVGQAGLTASLRLAEAGIDTICLEAQNWENYNVYPTDMAVYNSRFMTDRGVAPIDPLDIFNEYMNKSLGHVLPKLVRDYAFRSGEMFDWLLGYIPEELTKQYAHPVNYRGNPDFSGETNHQKSFIGMVQWRDQKTNLNMWGYTVRQLIVRGQELGIHYYFGTRGIRILQKTDGSVCGCLAMDAEGKQLYIHCPVVLVCAGDYGGNADMLLDLSDQLRNLAWSFGKDRTDATPLRVEGRDGSGIRMCMWAGGTVEAGPRAGLDCYRNRRPEFGFGGVWPCFGPDGRRFMNETTVRYGSTGACDMLPLGGIMTLITDSRWDQWLDRQGYGHEMMDRSNDEWHEELRRNMRDFKPGKAGFPVRCFGVTGTRYMTCYAAETLEELGSILGYSGENLQNFMKEIARYNHFCHQRRDEDWGCDPNYLFPIEVGPFFGVVQKIEDNPINGGLNQLAGICTDAHYNVVDNRKHPIPGLYAAGNTCGQRYAVQYHTPTAGNTCGSALTSGYVAAEHIMDYLKGKNRNETVK